MNSSVTNSHHDLHNYDAPCQGPSNRNNLPVQPCRCRAAERPETSRGRELVFLGGAAGRYSVSEFWLEPRTRVPGVSLLRTCGKRPRRCATSEGDELTSLHVHPRL